MAREIGVSLHTIHTVASDLRQHGYPLKVDIKTQESDASHSSHASHVSSPTPPEDVSGTSLGDSTQESHSAEDMEKEEKYVPGDVSQGDVSPRGSTRRTSSEHPRGR